MGILRGVIERVVIHPSEDGLQVEIVGEIVKMVELGLDAKQAALPAEAACSVKVVAGARFGRCFPLVSARELENHVCQLLLGPSATPVDTITRSLQRSVRSPIRS